MLHNLTNNLHNSQPDYNTGSDMSLYVKVYVDQFFERCYQMMPLMVQITRPVFNITLDIAITSVMSSFYINHKKFIYLHIDCTISIRKHSMMHNIAKPATFLLLQISSALRKINDPII